MAAALNIVVVEDHDVLRELTVSLLREHGHQVRGLTCAEEIDDEGARGPIDVLVVDLNLPGEDGLTLARRFRRAQPQAGILMLTSRGEVADRVAGYDSGADIYLTKPLQADELLAAVRALGRRHETSRVMGAERTGEGLVLHQGNLSVRGAAGLSLVTAPEASLLAALARAPGQQLETWRLLEAIGEDADTYARASFDVRIGRVRKKLVAAGAPAACLRAVRGVGYQLCVALQVR